MLIKIKVDTSRAQRQLTDLAKNIPKAVAKALTSTAYSVRKATIDEMKSKLDRPTAYALNQAMQVTEATPDKLQAVIGIGVKYHAPSKGTPYLRALGHHFIGGPRAWKRSEAALMRAGILPAGMAAVPPAKASWAVSLDRYGNVRPGFIVMLLSYFRAFGEQGYRANATDKSRARRAGMGRTASGYRTLKGVMYFVSYGRRGSAGGRSQHLPPGIWAKRGIHGSDVAPVLLFVKRPTYALRFHLQSIGRRVVAQKFDAKFQRELRALSGRQS